MKQTSCLIAALAASVLVSCRSAQADTPPALADLVIRESEEYYRSLSKARGGVPVAGLFFDYLESLKTNWTGTITREPKLFDFPTRVFHEVFQFYFAGRTNFEEETTQTLLAVPVPLRLDGKFVKESEVPSLARAGLNVRVAWFRLFAKLDPKVVILQDPHLASVGVPLQYLADLNKDYLIKLMTAEDLEVIMTAMREMPAFSDEYIATVSALHDQSYPGKGLAAARNVCPDRLTCFRSIVKPLAPGNKYGVRGMYQATWLKNPAIFEARAKALGAWIVRELDLVAAAVGTIESLKAKGGQGANPLVESLNDMSVLLDGNADAFARSKSQETAAPAQRSEPLSAAQLEYVRELNDYLNEPGERFIVDCGSHIERFVRALQQGGPQQSLVYGSACNPLTNLKRPVRLFAEFVRRNPTEALHSTLQALKGRVEQLQSLLGGE